MLQITIDAQKYHCLFACFQEVTYLCYRMKTLITETMDQNVKVEKDREATEKRLLDTIGKMIEENGFEKIGINAVAAQSGVSKVLIYRYFGSVEGLMAAYIRRHDFWINLPHGVPEGSVLPDFIKKMLRDQISQLRKDTTLKRLYRWELSSHNETIDELRQQRETTGLWIIDQVSKLANHPTEEVAAVAAILSAAITYLAMLEDFCPQYNGIQLNQDGGWAQIDKGIDVLIDKWLIFK